MIALILTLPFCALALFYVYRRFYCHKLFENAGIPGPKPHWLYGNILQLLQKDRHLVISRWTKEYGSIYGYYNGGNAVLVVSTTEAIERVCVKQFPEFQGHMILPIQADPDVDKHNPFAHLLLAKGKTWKRLRTICNPAFSSGKLKSYMDMLRDCEVDLMELYQEKAKTGEAFDVRDGFQLLTLEVIGNVGFGMHFDAIKGRGKNNVLLNSIRNFLGNSNNPTNIIRASFILPELKCVLKWLVFSELPIVSRFFRPGRKITAAIRQIINTRQSTTTRRTDILQNMLDVCAEAAENGAEKAMVKSLTENEMVAQCFLLFLAGYETTSTSLSFASYLLARHPEVQTKLRDEVLAAFPKNADGSLPVPDYETAMNKMQYLDCVCKETLRLYPVAINFFNRLVMNETTVCGVHVPEGTYGLTIDTWTVHNDESLWGPVDPRKYYPERFLPENSVGRPDSAYVPFGFGPRLCLGQRLALLEMKLTLSNMLMRFKIEFPKEEYPESGDIPISTLSGPLYPPEGVPVRLVSLN